MSGLLSIWYGESELDPAVRAEILVESARIEARVAILEILLAIGFGVWYQFRDPVFTGVSIFALITVAVLLGDAGMRRAAAKRLVGKGPQPRDGR